LIDRNKNAKKITYTTNYAHKKITKLIMSVEQLANQILIDDGFLVKSWDKE